MTLDEKYQHIILFDGVCNFCNVYVNRVLKNDRRNKFRFASLQSDTGKQMLKKYGLENVDSVLYIVSGKPYMKSSAVLRIAKDMTGLYPLLYGFVITPAFFRNWIYDIIARNRYRWFGKREVCMIPAPGDSAKFIE